MPYATYTRIHGLSPDIVHIARYRIQGAAYRAALSRVVARCIYGDMLRTYSIQGWQALRRSVAARGASRRPHAKRYGCRHAVVAVIRTPRRSAQRQYSAIRYARAERRPFANERQQPNGRYARRLFALPTPTTPPRCRRCRHAIRVAA
ncbi:hypothetical protein TNCT_586191 [Trichonephila clavata]|uniref:Uncharacterized protein n=1 Tax=Trichonephila clavata TaxID=2740835 RepID=A0A8X6IKF4_TRICU|nr:hypothetical protein TNCT_586191 [Trichonephila clavata]